MRAECSADFFFSSVCRLRLRKKYKKKSRIIACVLVIHLTFLNSQASRIFFALLPLRHLFCSLLFAHTLHTHKTRIAFFFSSVVIFFEYRAGSIATFVVCTLYVCAGERMYTQNSRFYLHARARSRKKSAQFIFVPEKLSAHEERR